MRQEGASLQNPTPWKDFQIVASPTSARCMAPVAAASSALAAAHRSLVAATSASAFLMAELTCGGLGCAQYNLGMHGGTRL